MSVNAKYIILYSVTAKKRPPPLNNMLQHAQYITQSNDTYTA